MINLKPKLWTRDFTLLISATVLGAAGGIAGSFALSFLVYEETGSTLAAALLIAINVIPGFVVPVVASPFMDRLPRKPFLVGGDAIDGVLYAAAGFYLLGHDFTYVGYLFFSLLLSSLSAFDSLAYQSIFPKLIPEGAEERGYTVSSMVYPVMQVVMAPAAAWLMEAVGVANILIGQGVLSVLAAAIESRIRVREERRLDGEGFSLRRWLGDLRDAAAYLKKERGLLAIFTYMAVTNGVAGGYSSLLVANFSAAPALYSLFSVAEFAGRSIGGAVRYKREIPRGKRYKYAFFAYNAYELMDAVLLWLPYPLMLVNRAAAGYLGIGSATMRLAAVQSYIPDEMRARINAFEGMLYYVGTGVFSLIVGALGEMMSPRAAVSVSALFTLAVCWLTIFRRRVEVGAVYDAQPATAA